VVVFERADAPLSGIWSRSGPAVLDFVKSHVFDPTDFVIRSDGVCGLNPQLARHVAGLAMHPWSFN
jgi:hypothetical protein